MRYLIFIIVSFLFSTQVFASQWCQWTNSQGKNCQSDSRGYILVDNFPVKTPSIANAGGWYKLNTIHPTLEDGQIIDSEVWAFANNEITHSWTVRSMTDAELNESNAQVMDINTYYLWKALLAKGVITTAEAQSYLPAELVNAYLARQAIEEAQ